jgi:hypothetical protein
MKRFELTKITSSALIIGLLSVGCDSKTTDPNSGKNNKDSIAEADANPPVGKYDNTIFSIPSPIQLSSIIQNSGAPYNFQMLNASNKVDLYSNTTAQALNLGIYGADLGYATLYDNQQEALKYMKSSKKLADIIGISEAFDDNTIRQIERNLDNKDSLLFLVSNSYRKADDFLQIRDRKHIGALIIVGGWIESIYFAANIGKIKKTQEITNLIGNQKHTLETILDKMLVNYVNEPGVQDLYTDLLNIRESFDKVEIKYEYVKPKHNKATKTTEILSKTSCSIDDATFKEIGKKIEVLRKKIIL